jgi:CheY-like chemotaxis protein
MNIFKDFIIIDDDDTNNRLCRKIIEKTFSDVNISTFTDPRQGLEHIVGIYSQKDNDSKAILLLDISMPVIDGWNFLDQFDILDGRIKDRVKIQLLSSSLNVKDMERAKTNKNVEYYLVKPLNIESVRQVVQMMNEKESK